MPTKAQLSELLDLSHAAQCQTIAAQQQAITTLQQQIACYERMLAG